MSKSSLEKIEKTLDALVAQQTVICERIAGLERAIGRRASDREAKLLKFLDQFRAGEALGETSLGAWIAVCDTPCLKGGLRTVQMREASHARLLEARIKELGGAPCFEIPDAIHERAMQESSSRTLGDAKKVFNFVQRFPDCDAALKPIFDMADSLDDDQETQFLLRTIAADERSTLEFFHEACALLNPN